MNLEVDREPPVPQPFDQVHLPQRSLPVEQGAVQPRREGEQLANPAGARQRGVPDVVLQVDVVVVLPGPLAKRGPGPVRAAAEQRRDVIDGQQLLVGVGQVVAISALRGLEQLQAADVHRLLTSLRDEEGRIQRRHQRHVAPSAWFSVSS